MTLQEIAAGQQRVVNLQAQRKTGSGIDSLNVAQNHEWPAVKQGKFSFDSNPITPPWISMPDGGIPFSTNGTISTPAFPSGWTDVIGPAGQYQMQVPNGFDGVIEAVVCFYNGGGFTNGSGSLIWRILLDGQAARNYDNILVQLGVTPFNGQTRLRVYSNQTVQFQVNNVSLGGGGTQIFCQFVGWYYPNKLS